MSEKVIYIVSMGGYPKHGLWDRVDEILSKYEGHSEWRYNSWGRHQYFYNSEGAQLMYFTNHHIPEGTDQIDVWSGIWGMNHDLAGVCGDTEALFDEPKEFIVDGQAYRYIGDIWGYNYDSTSPDDDRYEP